MQKYDQPHSDVTFCVTYYQRKGDLKKCVQHIRSSFPFSAVLVQETGGNVSWGRNELVRRVKTPYTFLLEEDVLVSKDLDLFQLKRILQDDRLMLCSVGLNEPSRRLVKYMAGNFEVGSTKVRLVDAPGVCVTPQGDQYKMAQYVVNVWLGKTALVRSVAWDERLMMGEHEKWFHDVMQSGGKWSAMSGQQVLHLRHRPAKYDKVRRARFKGGQRRAERIIGKEIVSSLSADNWTCGISRYPASRVAVPYGRQDTESITDVTFCITYWMRPRCLLRLIKSLTSRYPQARIQVQDTGGNLSRARNQLVAGCRTPFLFLMEEDMAITSEVDVLAMKKMLCGNDTLAGVSGGLRENRIARYCAATFHRRGQRGHVHIRDSEELNDELSMILCNLTYNWGIFRTEALQQVMWDERLELREHNEFFWRMCSATGWKMGCSRYAIRHFRSRPNPLYRFYRDRLHVFARLERKIVRGTFVGKYNPRIWDHIDTLNRNGRQRNGYSS